MTVTERLLIARAACFPDDLELAVHGKIVRPRLAGLVPRLAAEIARDDESGAITIRLGEWSLVDGFQPNHQSQVRWGDHQGPLDPAGTHCLAVTPLGAN